MVEDSIKSALKIMTKKEFDIVKSKYHIEPDRIAKIEKLIAESQPTDVLALSVIPGSGLKILDVKVINEERLEVFLQLLKEGAVQQ